MQLFPWQRLLDAVIPKLQQIVESLAAVGKLGPAERSDEPVGVGPLVGPTGSPSGTHWFLE